MNQRDIRFRAWDVENKCMDINPMASLQNTDADVYVNEVFDSSEYIFMQFTGLKDNNGKEIYSSDLVKWKDCVYEVGFNGYMWDLCFGDTWRGNGWDFFLNAENMEVLGNAFENPGLLTP